MTCAAEPLAGRPNLQCGAGACYCDGARRLDPRPVTMIGDLRLRSRAISLATRSDGASAPHARRAGLRIRRFLTQGRRTPRRAHRGTPQSWPAQCLSAGFSARSKVASERLPSQRSSSSSYADVWRRRLLPSSVARCRANARAANPDLSPSPARLNFAWRNLPARSSGYSLSSPAPITELHHTRTGRVALSR